jgi:hypothetical protein
VNSNADAEKADAPPRANAETATAADSALQAVADAEMEAALQERDPNEAQVEALLGDPTGKPLNPQLRGAKAWQPLPDVDMVAEFEVCFNSTHIHCTALPLHCTLSSDNCTCFTS